jgi:hypothetical protein
MSDNSTDDAVRSGNPPIHPSAAESVDTGIQEGEPPRRMEPALIPIVPARDNEFVILPYVSFSLTTPDEVSVLVRRLSANIDLMKYTGSLSNRGFKVVPKTWYRNSFLPVICGVFDERESGTVVHVMMRIRWPVVAFLGAWCGAVLSFFVPILQSILAGKTTWGVLFFPVFGLLFAAALAVGSFWWEAPQRRDDIARILLGADPPKKES